MQCTLCMLCYSLAHIDHYSNCFCILNNTCTYSLDYNIYLYISLHLSLSLYIYIYIQHDEVFTPVGRSDLGDGPVRSGVLANLWGLFITFTVGWLPGYLVFNATGPAKYRGKNANHFSANSVFIRNQEVN